jgi:hypothetical protein
MGDGAGGSAGQSADVVCEFFGRVKLVAALADLLGESPRC